MTHPDSYAKPPAGAQTLSLKLLSRRNSPSRRVQRTSSANDRRYADFKISHVPAFLSPSWGYASSYLPPMHASIPKDLLLTDGFFSEQTGSTFAPRSASPPPWWAAASARFGLTPMR
ncbi:hypothetical protein N8T08_008997 [Aspergillus melleus]|uniref:Uncharacterized protein n=1 Tax=Aspergillus melleus TaxID=138277 RepID=A0ACC3AUJ0_9EURO|nr:hypothetical protein N8T08_008997 [Aspergillus melleus]